MNIITCVKQVPYPDTPASAYKVDNENKKIVLPEDVPLVISPFDESAVEAGLQVKDKMGGTMTVISLATNPTEGVIKDLKQTVAMGADEAILLDDPAFEGGDSWSTAYTLAMAIKKIGEYDLILCGIQAADWDAGQVGIGIAEILGIPLAMQATKIKPKEGSVQVECLIDNGHDVVELPLPCVLAIASDESLMPRVAPLPRIIKAKKKQIPIWTAADIEADMAMVGVSGSKTSVTELTIPELEGKCEFITSDDPEAAAGALVEKLKNENII
jgi:electron transfer flavoprotein beta subunit